MSIASRKRRRAKRGGLLGHLGRVADSLALPPLPATASAADHFGRAIAEGADVYAHPETIAAIAAAACAIEAERAGLVALRADARLARGLVVAVKPSTVPPISIPLTFAEVDLEPSFRWEPFRRR